MTLSNVKLIFAREVRDQLRDRRTLFMIAVLPILLYPLLGMSLLQVSQFMQEQPTRVLVLGAKDLGDLPPLFDKQDNKHFCEALFSDPARGRLLELGFAWEQRDPGQATPDVRTDADRQLMLGNYEAVLYFPPDFATRLDAFRKEIFRRAEAYATGQRDTEREVPLAVPSPEIMYSTASDKSQITFARLSEVLRRWTEQIGDDNLAASGVPTIAARPFAVQGTDVAGDTGHRGAAVWSKILPVLLLLWALTGASIRPSTCAPAKKSGARSRRC